MKKIIYFTLIIFFVMVGVSFAAATTWSVTDSGPSGITTTTYPSMANVKTSHNVTIEVKSDAPSYAAISSHKSGDKLYGAASNSSVIMVDTADKSVGTDYTTAPTAADSGAFTTNNWSSM